MFTIKFKISNFLISDKNKSLIIAEIGNNHEGSLDKCIDLIKKARNSGADLVKMQVSNPESNYAPKTASYRVFSKSRLTREEIYNIYNFCKKKKIKIFSTFDRESLDFFLKLNPICFKISSSLFYDYFFVKQLLKYNKPVLISGGVVDLPDINVLFNLLKKEKNKQVGFLHSRSLYPAKYNKLNLSRIRYLKEKYKMIVGYSDHAVDIHASIAAINFGAKIIEKHFSLDSSRKGFDHKVSIEPKKFAEMVKQIRINESMHGKYNYLINENKKDFVDLKKVVRNFIINADIKKKEKIDPKKISIVRVKNNKYFSQFYKIFPKLMRNKINKNIFKGHKLKLNDF